MPPQGDIASPPVKITRIVMLELAVYFGIMLGLIALFFVW